MGFSGGGSNVLKPHTHDGTISQDGGALDMDGVTQGSLTAGDLVYSDGSNLQRLAIGGSGQSLTSSGTAPQWSVTGAAGSWVSLFEGKAVDDMDVGGSGDTTFDDYDWIWVFCQYELTAGDGAYIGYQVYDQTGLMTGASDYKSEGLQCSAGAGLVRVAVTDDFWDCGYSEKSNVTLGQVLFSTRPIKSGGHVTGYFNSNGSPNNYQGWEAGIGWIQNVNTSIRGIKIQLNAASAAIVTGSVTYKVMGLKAS